MTENMWLTCQNRPRNMFDRIQHRTGPRKLQLVAVAACRFVEDYISNEVLRQGVEMLERYAEGFASEIEFLAARRAVDTFLDKVYVDSEEFGVPAVVAAMDTDVRYGCRQAVLHVGRREASAASWDRRPDHRTARNSLCDIIREIVGNPFRPYLVVPSWQGGGVIQPDGRTVLFTDAVKGIAEAIHVTGDFGRLPILADALDEAGVTDEALLAHCRDGGPHLRGCWALDVVRGRA